MKRAVENYMSAMVDYFFVADGKTDQQVAKKRKRRASYENRHGNRHTRANDSSFASSYGERHGLRTADRTLAQEREKNNHQYYQQLIHDCLNCPQSSVDTDGLTLDDDDQAALRYWRNGGRDEVNENYHRTSQANSLPGQRHLYEVWTPDVAREYRVNRTQQNFSRHGQRWS